MKWIAILAAFVTFVVTNVAGVFLFFRRVAELDEGRELTVNPLLGITIYCFCGALLLAYTTRITGNAFKAATVIAAAQFILVNIDFVVRGERGLMTALASTVLLVLTWYATAGIYQLLDREKA